MYIGVVWCDVFCWFNSYVFTWLCYIIYCCIFLLYLNVFTCFYRVPVLQGWRILATPVLWILLYNASVAQFLLWFIFSLESTVMIWTSKKCTCTRMHAPTCTHTHNVVSMLLSEVLLACYIFLLWWIEEFTHIVLIPKVTVYWYLICILWQFLHYLPNLIFRY